MTTGTLTSDDGENDAVKAAENIVLIEAEAAALEATFVFAMKVGLWLKKWRAEMTRSDDEEGDGADVFTEEWTEHAAMTLFEKFFQPFYPPFPHMKDYDD